MLTKDEAKKYLSDAAPEQCFWVNNGPVVKDLRELHDAFWSMTADQFAHHIRDGRNDFANWIADILSDNATAAKLKKAKTKEAAAEVIKTALDAYTW